VTLLSLAAALGVVNFLLVRRGGFRNLARTAAVETGLGITAVLAAALLVTGSPASAAPPAEADSSLGSAHLFGDAGTSRIHLIVEIPAPGFSRTSSVTDRLTGGTGPMSRPCTCRSLQRGSRRHDGRGRRRPGLFGVRGDFLTSGGVWISGSPSAPDMGDESVGLPCLSIRPPTPSPPAATGFPLPACSTGRRLRCPWVGRLADSTACGWCRPAAAGGTTSGWPCCAGVAVARLWHTDASRNGRTGHLPRQRGKTAEPGCRTLLRIAYQRTVLRATDSGTVMDRWEAPAW
jgi:hypothetical protein